MTPLKPTWQAWLALCLLCLLPACSSMGAPKFTGVSVEVINTVDGINIVSSSFNGHPTGKSHGGGQSCCIPIPAQWQPGLTATIAWTKDPSPGTNPGGVKAPRWNPNGTVTPEWEAWMATHEANYTQHEVTMPLPRYSRTCGLTLVFLPCDEVRAIIDCDEYHKTFKDMNYLPSREWHREAIRRLGGKQQCQPN